MKNKLLRIETLQSVTSVKGKTINTTQTVIFVRSGGSNLYEDRKNRYVNYIIPLLRLRRPPKNSLLTSERVDLYEQE